MDLQTKERHIDFELPCSEKQVFLRSFNRHEFPFFAIFIKHRRSSLREK